MLLQVNHLCIEFHDEALPERAVEDLSFSLDQGEILGVVGESGSGKSMTALAVAGLLSRHDIKKSGEILFQGENLLNCPRHILRAMQGDDIGVIFQEPMSALNPVKRIGWQVEESLRIHRGYTKRERRGMALSMLEQVELGDPEKVYRQYPHELSGGMRQRVCIAAAMVCDPKLLIADEPTTALDVTIQAQIVRLLKRINRERRTAILFISHDLSLVRQLCGRVLVMQGGMLVEQGAAQEVFTHPAQEYTKRLVDAIPKVEAAGYPRKWNGVR